MKTSMTMMSVFLAALAALAVPVAAQKIGQKTPTATHHSSVRHPKKLQPKRSAELKTTQLTKRHAAHLETKEASLHHQIHSDREQDRTPTLKDEGQAQIHLKKHNARMF